MCALRSWAATKDMRGKAPPPALPAAALKHARQPAHAHPLLTPASPPPDANSKCMFELAVWSLVEQGVLSRQGAGGRALYTVLPSALEHAQDIAFREFPGDDLALLHTLRELQRVPCMAIAASSSGAPGPLQPRRHSHSPRGSSTAGTAVRLGVVRGVEKASARGRSCGGKRSFGDDISAQLLKKARLSPYGSGHPHPYAAAVGDVPMSP